MAIRKKRRGVNTSKLAKKLKEIEGSMKGSGSRNPRWKPQSGLNVIRICPSKDDNEFYEEWHIHWINSRPYPCLKFHAGEDDCPGCTEVEELQATGDEDDKSKASDLYPSATYNMNIVDRKDEESGVQTFAAGKTIFKDLLTYFTDSDWGDLTDPIDGYDVKIKKVGKGLNTEYTTTVAKNPTRLGNKKWLRNLTDLTELFTLRSAEEMEEALSGAGESKRGKKKKSRRSLTKRRDDYDDDMDEDDIVDDEDEDEEERPRRRKKVRKPRRKRSRSRDEEEDEDSRPVRRRKKKPVRRKKRRRAREDDEDFADDDMDDDLDEIEAEVKRRERTRRKKRRR